MIFSSLLFLLALPLVGVPIVLHFYKGRQVDEIEWGAMHFLVDAVADGRRWEKLEELILMLLRVAAVAALIFALAQPMIRGSWLGLHDRREVVMVIDDSLSTAVKVDDESVFSLIQKQAIAAIGDLTPEDHVHLMAASAGGRWLTTEPVAATAAGQRRLTELIETLSPTQGECHALDAFRAATGLDPLEGATERLVLLVTDSQSAAFAVEDSAAWEAWAEARDAVTPPITARVVDCGLGGAVPGNLAIGRLAASKEVIRKGERVTLRADVAGYGLDAPQKVKIAWRVGDKPLAKSETSVAPGETSQVTTTVQLKGEGPQLVMAEIEESDGLDLDQAAGIVVEISDKLPVLVVEAQGDADSRRDIRPSEHIAAALGYLDGEPQLWRSVFEPRTISPEELPETNLSEYRAVLVADVDQLDVEQVDRLRGYVATGGGLWATLGGSVDVDQFNAVWHDDGEGLCPLALVGMSDEQTDEAPPLAAADESARVAIHPPDADHPTTEHLANTTQLDIDQALLKRYWVFQEREQDEESEAGAASVLLRSGGGDPLAIERYLGRGRVIVQAFPHDLSWTSLPLRKAYVVMVHDWLDYLTAPTMGRHNIDPGAPIVAQAPVEENQLSSDAVTARVLTPADNAVELAARGDIATPVYRYSQTRLPGIYRVQFRSSDEVVEEVAFLAPRRLEESRLEPFTADQREWLTETIGIQFGAEDGAPVTDTATEPSLAPFWWTLLAILASLLVAELLLAGHVGQRRLGEPAIPAKAA